MHFQRFPSYLQKYTFSFIGGKHVFAGTHNILKVRDLGFPGGMWIKELHRGRWESICANNHNHISNKSFSTPLLFYWSKIVDLKLGINFKSSIKGSILYE